MTGCVSRDRVTESGLLRLSLLTKFSIDD